MDYEIVKGEGRFIFFLHGFGGDKNSFAIIKNHIAKGARNMVFLSFAGFGKTPEMSKPYSVSDYANDLYELITELSPNESVDIVCHSFGARVAAKLISQHEGVVHKLLITGGAGVKPRRGIKYHYNVLKYKLAKKRVAAGKADKSILEKYGSSDYKKLSPVMKQTFINVVNEDLKNDLKKIKVQTLLFWGEKDTETPLYMAKKMNKWIINSSLIISKGSGHFAYLEDFYSFLHLFNEFIN